MGGKSAKNRRRIPPNIAVLSCRVTTKAGRLIRTRILCRLPVSWDAGLAVFARRPVQEVVERRPNGLHVHRPFAVGALLGHPPAGGRGEGGGGGGGVRDVGQPRGVAAGLAELLRA